MSKTEAPALSEGDEFEAVLENFVAQQRVPYTVFNSKRVETVSSGVL